MAANRFVTEGLFIEREAGALEFYLDDHHEVTDQQFFAKVIDYRLVRQGASVLIYDKVEDVLVSVFKPFDNTQLICDPRGYDMAAVLGAERFLVGAAYNQPPEEKLNVGKAIPFSRDLSFSLKVSQAEIAKIPFKVVNLADLLKIYQGAEAKLYLDLVDIFLRCANYAPEKMGEYVDVTDMMCRFNLENTSQGGPVTDHVFLLDNSNKIIGTMSSTLIMGANGDIDIYFYDEVVDYFTLSNHTQTNKLSQAKKTEAKDGIDNHLEMCIEARRTVLLAHLFVAARQSATKAIEKMRENFSSAPLDEMAVRAFIRVAEGREEYYKTLNCGKEKLDMYVIHGARTTYGDKLAECVNTWLEKKFRAIIVELKEPSPQPSAAALRLPQGSYAIADMIAQNRGYGNAGGSVPEETNSMLTEPKTVTFSK
ncbi:MAG: hypothetical protein P4M14_10675 [Gammaproteobacteria bacterium]|nr:hypothetical protein [Gammaproteobacteria bacterium]